MKMMMTFLQLRLIIVYSSTIMLLKDQRIWVVAMEELSLSVLNSRLQIKQLSQTPFSWVIQQIEQEVQSILIILSPQLMKIVSLS